ncbi:MAG: SRPBCC domain-containing protein [Terriglobales bacterium]
MGNPTENTYRMSVRRRMPAPREVVYEAWIDPQGIREWMCPGDVTSAEAVLDVRVGGSYRIVMKGKERDHVHTGVYQIVEPNSKLVFTWTQEGSEASTLVTVEFLAHGSESELVLTHERFTQQDVSKRYESGWGTIADKLAGYLTQRTRATASGGKKSK